MKDWVKGENKWKAKVMFYQFINHKALDNATNCTRIYIYIYVYIQY